MRNKAGHSANLADWNAAAIAFAADAVKEFEQSIRSSAKPESRTAA